MDMILLFVAVIGASSYVNGQSACTYITLWSEGAEIRSHSLYGISPYESDTANCWQISVGDTYSISNPVIKLTSRAFNLESTSDCSYDYLKVYDGSSDIYHSNLVNTYCGTNGQIHVHGSRTQMYLEFNSDSSVEKSGFLLVANVSDGFQSDWSIYNPIANQITDFGSSPESVTLSPDVIGAIHDAGVAVATVAGIIVGVIVLIIVVIVVVVVVVVCCIMNGRNQGRVIQNTAQPVPVPVYPQPAYGQAVNGQYLPPPPPLQLQVDSTPKAYPTQQMPAQYMAPPPYPAPAQGVPQQGYVPSAPGSAPPVAPQQPSFPEAEKTNAAFNSDE